MVPIRGIKVGAAFREPHEFQVRSPVESGGAPPHSKTLARWLLGARRSARFWSSAPPARAVWISYEVQGLNPMRKSRKEALPEPQSAAGILPADLPEHFRGPFEVVGASCLI